MKIVGTVKHQVPSGYSYREVNRKVGICEECGREVELLDHTNRCRCGQRYNLFGQAVNRSVLG